MQIFKLIGRLHVSENYVGKFRYADRKNTTYQTNKSVIKTNKIDRKKGKEY